MGHFIWRGPPQLSDAWFFDRGVIWSEGSDLPAELGSPTAIGDFRDTDWPAARSIGQLQRRSCPLTSVLRPAEVLRQLLRGCVSFLPSHVLVRIKSAPPRGTALLTAYRPDRTRSMRLFGLLGGGWSINFSQQTLRRIQAFDPGSRRSSGFWLRKALSLGPGVIIGVLRRPGLSRHRVEPEIDRCRPSSENLTIGSAPKMTGVDVKRT